MKIHLIGVSGMGMAPLAGLLVQAGHEVSGSDIHFDPPMGPRLERWGVRTMAGFDSAHLAHLDPKTDLVVVGNVCRRDHPLVLEAQRLGLRLVSMPTALREFIFETPFGRREVIVVAGTHGKTTTTALVASILSNAKVEPGYLIGGVPIQPIEQHSNEAKPFAMGHVKKSLHKFNENGQRAFELAPFVIEGDEYDSAFFEKVPKFLGYVPRAVILTSIEHDHIDIYSNFESYLAAFQNLIRQIPSEKQGGLLIVNAGDPVLVNLIETTQPSCRVVYYAATDSSGRVFPSKQLITELSIVPTWLAHEVGLVDEHNSLPSFDLFIGPSSVGRFSLNVFGVHNVANALASLALSVEMCSIPLRDAASTLHLFHGIERRQQKLIDGAKTTKKVTLYIDFAHHPTAVHATLSALRNRHLHARILVVYEARSATACRNYHQQEYETAFTLADVVVFAPLGRSTIAESERLDVVALRNSLLKQEKEVYLAQSIDNIFEIITSMVQPNDIVVIMSNGTLHNIDQKLQQFLSGPLS